MLCIEGNTMTDNHATLNPEPFYKGRVAGVNSDSELDKNQTKTRLVKRKKPASVEDLDASLTIKITAKEKQDFLEACSICNQVPMKVMRDLMVKYADVIKEQTTKQS